MIDSFISLQEAHHICTKPCIFKSLLSRPHSSVFGEDEFTPSCAASDSELLLLRDPLTLFYHERVILDVLAPVKGGKEASVYCCRAHPSTGMDLIAAKIYRPRMFRSLRNDAPYKEGRESLDDQGKAIRDQRRQRAMLKKTVDGKQVEISS